MARPKSINPPKGKLTVSVDEQTRQELTFISQQTGKSISSFIAEWAKKESRKVARAKSAALPDAAQMIIEEV